jgi:hypothetical protein
LLARCPTLVFQSACAHPLHPRAGSPAQRPLSSRGTLVDRRPVPWPAQPRSAIRHLLCLLLAACSGPRQRVELLVSPQQQRRRQLALLLSEVPAAAGPCHPRLPATVMHPHRPAMPSACCSRFQPSPRPSHGTACSTCRTLVRCCQAFYPHRLGRPPR